MSLNPFTKQTFNKFFPPDEDAGFEARMQNLYDQLEEELPIIDWPGRAIMEKKLKNERQNIEAQMFQLCEDPVNNEKKLVFLASSRRAINLVLSIFDNSVKNAKKLNKEIEDKIAITEKAVEAGLPVKL